MKAFSPVRKRGFSSPALLYLTESSTYCCGVAEVVKRPSLTVIDSPFLTGAVNLKVS